jgi:PhnB protein
LQGLLAEVADGRSRSVRVEGEPGIGNPALMAEALAGAANLGYYPAVGGRALSTTSGGTVTTPDPITAVVPMLAYEDGPAAMDWLADAFGFVERTRIVEEGRLTHGEMQAGRGLIMLATPARDYQGPRRHREHCDAARAWSAAPFVIDGVMVRVEDIDTHYKRAEDRGAVLLSGIETAPPGRLYRAEDIEGHRWMFLQPH